jgi:hypothetical protein
VPNLGRIIRSPHPSHTATAVARCLICAVRVLITVKVTNGQNINLAIASARVTQLHGETLRPLKDLPTKSKSDLAESLYRTGLESL